ncbi:MAG: tetraacyldisaccharide 4'-kinase [Fluviicola sp.]|nr:MAG: tetraacyldisaccharide 4'-kinase [Fluviicola sp.]
MKVIRWLLLPFSWLYGVITFLRNKAYDWSILKSYRIPKKSITVGNLSVGGTGKTPHVDYLIQYFLSKNTQLSILSRGYGRKTDGLIVASDQSTASEIGDEPLQYVQRYPGKIKVVLAEKRKEGVDHIINQFPKNELIILDDAFQHRAVSAGFSILITPFNDLFSDDFMLPTGNLREWKAGKNRADIVVVSKSPSEIPSNEESLIIRKLGFDAKRVFFSSLEYNDLVSFSNQAQTNEIEHALIVTGIGNPTPLVDYWKSKCTVELMAFPDHHNYSTADIKAIHEKFGKFASENKVIITTEKDYMRLQQFDEVFDKKNAWHYQPITVRIKNQKTFNSLLDEYFR